MFWWRVYIILWADIMFESPHSTICCRVSTFKWLIFLVIWYHSVRILSFWWLHVVLWYIFHLSHKIYHNCLELVNTRLSWFIIFLVVINCILYHEKLNHKICFPYFSVHLELRILSDEVQGNRYRIMDMKKNDIWIRGVLIIKQPGEISVLSTQFLLRKFGILGSRVYERS